MIDQQAEPHQLYAIQANLAAEQIDWSNELEEFAKVFFKPKPTTTALYMHRVNAPQLAAQQKFLEAINITPAAEWGQLGLEEEYEGES